MSVLLWSLLAWVEHACVSDETLRLLHHRRPLISEVSMSALSMVNFEGRDSSIDIVWLLLDTEGMSLIEAGSIVVLSCDRLVVSLSWLILLGASLVIRLG